MKMEIIVKIKNDDGTEIIKPVVIDTEIPEFGEFKNANNFKEVFHKYEQAVLKARNIAAELVSIAKTWLTLTLISNIIQVPRTSVDKQDEYIPL